MSSVQFVHYAALLGATLIEPSPTFGDARRYASMHQMPVIQIPVKQQFETDIAALKAQADSVNGPVLVNICNPNNPTGTIVDADALSDWITNSKADTLFLIDEAYFEYAVINPAYRSAVNLINSRPEQVLVTRTFSKIYAMAGMRIGYGIASPELSKKVSRLASDFNLSVAGAAAAIVALNDKDFYQTSLNANHKARQVLIDVLDELQLEFIPSNTNFVLHKIKGPVEIYQQRMLANGFKVGRRMTKSDDWNRLSIGTSEQMQSFVKTLKAFRQKGWV